MVKVWRFHWLNLCCFTAIVKWGQTSSHLLKTSSFKLLDSNRQPVYYYNEHGQVEIVVITRKEFFKLTFLSFGIPNANRWDVEFSLSNLLKVLKNAWNSEIRLNLKQCLRLALFITKMLKVLQNAWNSEIRLNLKQCLRFPLFHHKMLKVLQNSEIRLNLKQWLRIGGFIDYICAVLLP